MPAERVPKNATPTATCVRAWDGVTLGFYVLKRWRRSHDRVVDGSTYYLPVAAVPTGDVIWRGARYDTEADAVEAARQACASVVTDHKE